jgi:uncharacterized membrane protein
LVAAGLFAISPEGVVWGARARMYALATLLVLITVYLAYRGSVPPAAARYRWLALGVLLAALLTQLGVLLLIPPLVIAMLIVGYISSRAFQPSAFSPQPSPASLWFLKKAVIAEIIALLGIIGLAVWVKRLGQPLGAATIGAPSNDNLLTELLNTVAYQTTFHFTWPDTEQFLARQFGVDHHLWLATAAVAALLVNVVLFIAAQTRNKNHLEHSSPGDIAAIKSVHHSPFTIHHSPLPFLSSNFLFSNFQLFLWLTFGLIIVEMVTLLEPFRRNPRYIMMFLPLFYLIAAGALTYLLWLVLFATQQFLRQRRNLPAVAIHPITALLVVVGAAFIGYSDLRVALDTPEPNYPQAFARVLAGWQSGRCLAHHEHPRRRTLFGPGRWLHHSK